MMMMMMIPMIMNHESCWWNNKDTFGYVWMFWGKHMMTILHIPLGWFWTRFFFHGIVEDGALPPSAPWCNTTDWHRLTAPLKGPSELYHRTIPYNPPNCCKTSPCNWRKGPITKQLIWTSKKTKTPGAPSSKCTRRLWCCSTEPFHQDRKQT